MIFVTVGTHEQPFNRLVEYMDKWAMKNDEKVVIQTGFSTYNATHCEAHKMMSFDEMHLSLNNIYQRPFVKQDDRRLVKKREDDEKSSATNAQRQEESNQNSKSKGLQYVEQKKPA